MSLMKQPLIRLVVVNSVIGVVASAAVVIGLLAVNAHGLRTLVFASPDGALAVILLMFGFVVTLCSVAIGTGVMMQGNRDDGRGDDHGGRGARTGDLIPVQVPAKAPAHGARRG